MTQVFSDLLWRVIITDTSTVTLALLDHRATNRAFNFTLNAPASHSGQVASDDPVINLPYPDPTDPAYLTNNRRLVYAFRRERTTPADALNDAYVCRFGGILMNVEDQGADAATATYTAYDPWQYLMSRPVRNPDTLAIPGSDGLTFPAGTRASDIAYLLLITSEVVDGDTHIDIEGTTSPLFEATDPLPDPITFPEGLSVGEAWQQLVATGTIDIVLPPLYDITKPGKVCEFATSPLYGETRFDTVFAWDVGPHSAIGISRLVDGTRMANKVQWWSDGKPIPLQTDAGSVTANGEWWAQQSFPSQEYAGLLEVGALAELLIRRYGSRTITFDPAPERSEVPLRDYGLGDYVAVWASRNFREPLGIESFGFDPDFPGASGYQRIQQIPITVDDNGATLVQGLSTTKENV